MTIASSNLSLKPEGGDREVTSPVLTTRTKRSGFCKPTTTRTASRTSNLALARVYTNGADPKLGTCTSRKEVVRGEGPT
jgi:hypothetical protein